VLTGPYPRALIQAAKIANRRNFNVTDLDFHKSQHLNARELGALRYRMVHNFLKSRLSMMAVNLRQPAEKRRSIHVNQWGAA
jgi:hypothetical protein